MKTGIDLVIAERNHQIAKGFDVNHDDDHENEELIEAAKAYLDPFTSFNANEIPKDERNEGDKDLPPLFVPVSWPWKPEEWKGSNDDRITQLSKAAAFIIAEIDRRLRIPKINQQ